MNNHEFFTAQIAAQKDLIALQQRQADIMTKLAQNIELSNRDLRLGGMKRTPSRVLYRKAGTYSSDTLKYNGLAANRFTLHVLYATSQGGPSSTLGQIYAKVGKDAESSEQFGGNNLSGTIANDATDGPLAKWDLREFAKHIFAPNGYDLPSGTFDSSGDGSTSGNIDPVTGDVATNFTFPSFLWSAVMNATFDSGREMTFEADFYFTQMKIVLPSNAEYSLTIWGE